MALSQRQLFLQHLAQTTDFPMGLEIERAEGSYLFDTNGKKYLDLISGISVSSIGHRHPKVVEAIKTQVDKNKAEVSVSSYSDDYTMKIAKSYIAAGLTAKEFADKVMEKEPDRPFISNKAKEYTKTALIHKFQSVQQQLKKAQPDYNSNDLLGSIMLPTSFIFNIIHQSR